MLLYLGTWVGKSLLFRRIYFWAKHPAQIRHFRPPTSIVTTLPWRVSPNGSAPTPQRSETTPWNSSTTKTWGEEGSSFRLGFAFFYSSFSPRDQSKLHIKSLTTKVHPTLCPDSHQNDFSPTFQVENPLTVLFYVICHKILSCQNIITSSVSPELLHGFARGLAPNKYEGYLASKLISVTTLEKPRSIWFKTIHIGIIEQYRRNLRIFSVLTI